MTNITDFYDSILNIRMFKEQETEKLIKEIVKEEKQNLQEISSELDGFCKYLASQIQESLEQHQIKSYWIDLKDIVNIDHVVLIAQYKTENGQKSDLIDPSFTQFVKQDHKSLVKLETWPSENIKDQKIVQDLVTTGVVSLSDERWGDYLSAFNSQIKAPV